MTLTAGDLTRRRAGVCLHLTSLPGPGGIGDMGACARRFMDWMCAHGLSVWQFLPTVPTGYGNSPYQPLSVFAGNPLLISLNALVEWGLLKPEEINHPGDWENRQTDYDRVAAFKTPLLARAAERFVARKDSALETAYEAFCNENEALWLSDFAAFVQLKAKHSGAPWSDWPAESRARGAHALSDLRDADAAALDRIKIIQFFFDRQWQALHAEAERRGILLFGDVPIYMAYDCAEAWAHPELLQLDDQLMPEEVAGVPPDYFSADGQLWGNPVYRWDVHAADGFDWWISRLQHALSAADVVRLDHFRGFDEYWSVHFGALTAREGRWRQGPAGALFDAVRAALGEVPLVAEDLGMITESVLALRRAYALPGMQVLQFLVDQQDFDLGAIEADCVCYTGTHDNDTTVGWFAGHSAAVTETEAAERQAIILHNVEGSRDNLHKDMIYLCFRSAASLAIAPLQDFLGLDSSARLNTPGRAEGNWRWRATQAEIDAADSDYIGNWARDTGRT